MTARYDRWLALPLLSVLLGPVAAAAPGQYRRPPPRPQQPRSAYESMPEPDVARLAVRFYLGDLDQVDASASEGEVTTGQFTFTEVADLRAFRRRVDAIVHRAQPDDNIGHALCVRREQLEHSKSDADAATACKSLESTRAWLDNGDIAHDPVLRSMYVEWMLSAIGDDAFATTTRLKVASSFGFTGKRLRYHVNDPAVSNTTGDVIVLTTTEPNTWSRATLRGAIHYAKDHALATDMVATLETGLTQAPAYRCNWLPDLVVEEHLDSGAYGPARRADEGTVLRPDNPVGTGGEVSCGELRTLAGDRTLLAVIKRGVKDPTPVMAVVPGTDWDVELSATGDPIRKIRIVKVYSRVEW
jgi:hypothetical protein